MQEFIIAIRKHESLSYIFSVYFIKQADTRNYKIVKRATLDEITTNPDEFTEGQKEIVKIIDSYADHNLMKVFAKKRMSQLDFFKSLSKDGLSEKIRLFLEKKLLKIYNIANAEKIRIFHKTVKYNTLYANDEYSTHKIPAKTILNIQRTNDGILYHLSIKQDSIEINLSDHSGFVFLNEPCLLALGQNIYRFEDVDGKKLKPFFLKKFIKIPKSAEKKWLETFALKAIKKYHVKAEGFDIETENKPLNVQIILEKDWKNELILFLKFCYASHVFNLDDRQYSKVIFDDKTFAFKKFIRKENEEADYINKLKTLGLKVFDKKYLKLSDNFESSSEQYYATVKWIINNRAKLKEWGIEFKQNLSSNIFLDQKPKMNFSIALKNDWFDISAMAIFGKFKIPFIELKDNILNKVREFILPDDSIAIIPEEWFAKYSDILHLSQKYKNALRLRKSNFMVLTKTEKVSPELSYLENLTELTNEKSTPISIPKGIRAKLRTYQKEGFQKMYQMQLAGLGMCLADDMGLGKTLQTITLLQKTKNERTKNLAATTVNNTTTNNVAGTQLSLFAEVCNHEKPNETKPDFRKPSLIVMPVSLLHNWINEIKKFSPLLKVLLYHGSSRYSNLKNFANYDIIITGYSIVRNDIEELEKQDFLYVILDESQYIKNPASQTYKSVLRLQSEHRLVLTGTPIENSLSDLWAQMNFINPGLLGNRKFFKENFQIPIEKNNSDDNAQRLKLLTSPFILRRTKQQVAKDLPALSEQIIYCEMSEEQQKIYDTEKSKIRNELLEAYEKQKQQHNAVRVIQALSKLRQIANHPILTDTEYKEDSGKFIEILRAVENVIEEGHKVLIFSSFVKHLNLFKQQFNEKNLKFSMLTGATPNRETVINEFQNNSDNRIFLISLKAGGTGLNLTAADYVFIIDPWWNPAAEKQAINRAHRIGQDKKVFVYKYISSGTVEEKILKLQKRKQKLSDEIISNEAVLNFTNPDEIKRLFE